MLSKETKQEVINQINERFKSNPSVFVLEFKGLTVKELENVRKDLRQTNSELKIVKNTLLKKAAEDTDAGQLSNLFDRIAPIHTLGLVAGQLHRH